MFVTAFTPPEYFGANMYVISSEGFGAVIDPSSDYFEIKDFLIRNNIDVKYVILTHAHFDHIFEIDSWAKNTSCEVIVGVNEAPSLADSNLNCYKLFFNLDRKYLGPYSTVKDGDVLELGCESIRIIETPGHSAGSISLSVDNKLFVGDTVFAGNSYGRTDLPGGDAKKLFESINLIKSLPPETVVYPGHGPKTSVAELKRNLI